MMQLNRKANLTCGGVLAAVLTGWAPADVGVRPPTPTAPPERVSGAADAQNDLVRHGLLREGSHLLQARGRILEHEATSTLRLIIDPVDEDAARYTLTLLPNTYLGELEQLLEASEGQRHVFELSGRVTVHGNRNFLLVTHPPRVVGTSVEEDLPADDGDDVEVQEPQPRDAGSIMRDLERDAGPVHRRISSGAATRRDAAQSDQLMREGSNIIMRRGKINRDAGGAWIFVFDADASGMADPPMTLMPCLLLHQLEQHWTVRGNAPVLISGTVYLHDNRNHLLPTVFQRPLNRTALTP